MRNAYLENTLRYNPSLCNGCGACVTVCPHRVFRMNGAKAVAAYPTRCMECGACSRNCPTAAIEVRSGVGCAAALMYAALTRKPVTCCTRDQTPCCP